MAGEMRQLRVLHLVKTSIGATWAYRQMRELVKLGVEVHVALPAGGSLMSEYQAAGVRVYPMGVDLPAWRFWQWPRLFAKLRKLVAHVKPDIIHSHHVGPTLAIRLSLGKGHPVPRVFQVPGPLHLEHVFFRWGELLLAGEPDYWIGSCQWTCRRYSRSGIPTERIFLSYSGTDIDHFVPRPKGKLRGELGIGDSTKIAGMVAYMYPPKRYLGQTRGLKGHEDLIDAIAICLKIEPDIVGVFVGGAWGGAKNYEERVRAYGKRRCGDRTIFLGTRDDVPELYADFDVAVHPSHSENVGAACESLLLAVPTIATAVGGFPDIVVPCKTGWLVPPRSPRQLAQAILEALHDRTRASKMAIEGQRQVRKLFDVKRTAQEVLDVYHSILPI